MDIGFTGWSFFCVAYDDTPTDSVELFTYDDVALAGGIPGLGNAADVGVAVENAIGLWNGISDARLTLSAVSGPASSAGYSQIMYQSGHHPETNVLGAVIEMGSQGSPDVLYSYILIYEEYLPEPASAGGAPLPPSPSPLTINGSYSSVSLTSVLAHEIGHALGIDHLLDPSTGYLMSEELRYNFNPPLSPTGEWAAKFLYPDWLQSPIPQGGSITGSCNPPA